MRILLKHVVQVSIFATFWMIASCSEIETKKGTENPNDDSIERLSQAVSKKITKLNITEKPFCYHLALNNSSTPGALPNGLIPQLYPKQHAIIWPSRKYSNYENNSQKNALEYFVAHDIFEVNDIVYNVGQNINGGAKAGVSYSLTENGFNQLHPHFRHQSNSFCFTAGTISLKGIDSITKTNELVNNSPVFEVAFQTMVSDAPDWYLNPMARIHLPGLLEIIPKENLTLKFVKHQEDWHYFDDFLSIANSDDPNSEKIMKNKKIDAATPDIVRSWLLNSPAKLPGDRHRIIDNQFCLLVPNYTNELLKVGAISKKNETIYIQDREWEHSIDIGKISQYLYFNVSLMKANKASITPLIKSQPNGNAVVQGYRLRIYDDAIGEVTDKDYCIPLGRPFVKKIEVQSHRDQFVFKGSMAFKEAPSWVAKMSEHYPEINFILENEINFRGSFEVLAAPTAIEKNKLKKLNIGFPKFSYTSLPTSLSEGLPRLAESLKHSRVNIAYRVLSAKPREKARSPKKSIQSASDLLFKDLTRFPIEPLRSMISADIPSEFHVLVYSDEPPNKYGNDSDNASKKISVTIKKEDISLLLISDANAVWNLKVEPGGSIGQISSPFHNFVIVNGRPVKTGDMSNSIRFGREYDSHPISHWMMDRGPNGNIARKSFFEKLAPHSKAIIEVKSAYKDTGFIIDDSTEKKMLTERKPILDREFRIMGNAVLTETNMYRTTFSVEGAPSIMYSGNTFNSGKYYFEATLKTLNSEVVKNVGSIGFCIAKSERSIGLGGNNIYLKNFLGRHTLELRDGDVVGVAADFDKQRIYFRLNDNWITPPPAVAQQNAHAKNNVLNNEVATHYRLCVSPPGSDRKKSAAWHVNLGGNQYYYPLPDGFTSFSRNASQVVKEEKTEDHTSFRCGDNTDRAYAIGFIPPVSVTKSASYRYKLKHDSMASGFSSTHGEKDASKKTTNTRPVASAD